MVHNLRAMMDAVGYVTRYGIQWRALPADFPPHEAVYVRLALGSHPARRPFGVALYVDFDATELDWRSYRIDWCR